MTIERIQPGARMSKAVVHDSTVYVSGQVADNAAALPSVRAQTKQILQQIDELLAQAGSGKEHLLAASVWLTNMDGFAEMNEVWEAWLAPGCAPARATVEARLARPDILVEIAVTAATRV